jgi:hypothetical protein
LQSPAHLQHSPSQLVRRQYSGQLPAEKGNPSGPRSWMDVSSIALGDGFRNRMRLVTDNRGVRMLPKFAGLASGSFVPDTHPMVAFRAGTVCDRVVASSSGGGLFGRPVISYPGRFLFFRPKALRSRTPDASRKQPISPDPTIDPESNAFTLPGLGASISRIQNQLVL